MSIISSLGKTRDFEAAARDFYRKNPQSESWKMIQALGRTLDRKNPLYAGNSNLDVAARFLQQLAINRKRLVGDILVEMGVLSEQDLINGMRDFDPKKHGRFGGYLVSHKMVTHAQLSEALLRQQGIGEGAMSGTRLTLQEMEEFMANFDPDRDGSIGEYLVSNGVITPEQLDKVLHQQQEEESPVDNLPEQELPADDSARDKGAIPYDNFPVRDKMTRKREIDGVGEAVKPKGIGLPGSIPTLPDIDFDIGSKHKDKPET
jgi:hypothetical protein